MSNSSYNYTRVWEIHETLHPKPDDLVSPSRFFIREGEMHIWDDKKKKKKKRYFFLFNDILLLCRRESHKRFWLRIHITLRSPYVNVEEIENASFNNEFRLHCRSRSFILYAVSPESKKEWIQDIRNSISGSHDEEKKDGKADTDKIDDNKEHRKSIRREKNPNKKGPKRDDDSGDDDDSSDTEEQEASPPKSKTKSTPKVESEEQRKPRKSGTKKKRKR